MKQRVGAEGEGRGCGARRTESRSRSKAVVTLSGLISETEREDLRRSWRQWH